MNKGSGGENFFCWIRLRFLGENNLNKKKKKKVRKSDYLMKFYVSS